ncbi:hypothetical protein WMY93_026292 [Mugilogobius chulae]|uniref:L1 transposable element RRM domain-containing protein n=1 Tax=Mugilogobius chulae TaxID=88201 RepID=A0AAW0N1V3_9GOBI
MPKPNKTDKKLQKHTEIAEETGAARTEKLANQDGEANTTTQHDTLSQSIAFFAGELQEFKKDIKRDFGELRHEVKNTMKEDLKLFREEMLQELHNQREEMTKAQTRIADLETACLEMTDTLIIAMKRNQEMHDKIVDLESRGRRNNLRIYGIPEEKEGKSVLDFVSDLFKTHIKLPEGVQLQIQRAHRALIPQPALTAAPRSIIVAFLQFQRKAYGPIKAALKSKGIRFNTPYTKMRVFWENGTRGYEIRDNGM